MKIITFNEQKFKFKKGYFTDLDCWYDEQYTEVEEAYKNEEITGQQFAELIQSLDETYDEIFNAI